MKQWIMIGIVGLAFSIVLARAEQLSEADKKAIESANEYVVRGNAFVESNSLPRAKVEYERAIRIFPRHVDALYNLAVVYDKLNQSDDAIATYKRYLAIKPDDADAWTQLGVRYDESNQPAEAQAAYEKALAAAPNFGRAHHNLGVLLKEQGKFGAAQKHLETFVHLEEQGGGAQNGDAYYSLGALYLAQAKLKEAKRLFQKALDVDPSIPYYNNAMGDVYMGEKDYGAALVCYKKALDKDEKNAAFYSGIGDAYRHLKQSDKALQSYGKALQLRPDYHLVQFKLGLLFEESNPAEAIKQFEKYLTSGKSTEFKKEAKEKIEKLKQTSKK
jgi:tetratricopeptide (TPR) repeat protein